MSEKKLSRNIAKRKSRNHVFADSLKLLWKTDKKLVSKSSEHKNMRDKKIEQEFCKTIFNKPLAVGCREIFLWVYQKIGLLFPLKFF